MLTETVVLDLADEKASYGTGILARMGARVIKIEPPGGDPARRIGPFSGGASHPPRSLSFSYSNTNKLGISLNLAKPEGRALFLRLAARADVVVETFSPEEEERFDCAYDVLNALNPRLIHVAATGFGRNGPRKNYKSCDLVASAFGGSMFVTGSPEAPPLKPAGGQACNSLSLFVVLAILLALRNRQKTGRGVHLDLSLQEAVASTLEHVMPRFFHDKDKASRRGSRHWDDAFCIFPCRDGFIQMTVFQQWETIVAWMAAEGAAADLEEDRWNEEEYRRNNVGHIMDVMTGWTKNHSAKELYEKGQLMGFPWAPVNAPAAVLGNEQLKDRGFFIPLKDGDGDIIGYPGLPFRFNIAGLPQLKREPSIGEDNRLIYHHELGLSDDELRGLAEGGII